MIDDHDFQKRLAKLQIQASAVISVGAVLIALGFSSVEFSINIPDNPDNLSNWRAIIFFFSGTGLMLYHLFNIRNKINELK